MELFDLVSCNRGALPEFLQREGRSDHLKSMVLEVERDDRARFGYPKHIFKSYFSNLNLGIWTDYMRRTRKRGADISRIGISCELPTIELCRVLKSLVTYAKSEKLREVGAGPGLLSKMLQFHLAIPITATDKYAPESPDQTFVEVRGESFEETTLEASEDVTISWLHPTAEQAFLSMIEHNQPNNVWHVGQLAGAACFSNDFVTRMKSLGYGYIPVTAKQFSHIDYFFDEERTEENVSRTSIAWFSKRPFPALASICRPEDLARYRTISGEELHAYIMKYYSGLTENQLAKIDLSGFY